MARYYVVREHARPFLSSVPTFVEGDGAEVDDRVEGDRWVAEMDKAQRFARETIDGVLGADAWAALLGGIAARDQRDPPERIAAPTREDRAKDARKAHGDGARKARREAEEREARETEAARQQAIRTALAANDEPAALALMTDEERAAHEERKRVAAQKPQESKP